MKISKQRHRRMGWILTGKGLTVGYRGVYISTSLSGYTFKISAIYTLDYMLCLNKK